MKPLYTTVFMGKKHIVLLFFSLIFNLALAQQDKGYIISIEGDDIYIDFTESDINKNSDIEIISEESFITHPVTGKKIKKKDSVLGSMIVYETSPEYSIARLSDKNLTSKIKVGMKIRIKGIKISNKIQQPIKNDINTNVTHDMPMSQQQIVSTDNNDDRIAVVIAPAEVNDVVNSGHFGGYVADILMEELLMCNKIRLLDRSVLNAQIDESNLIGGIIDPSTAIERGKVAGAKYIIQCTMQKPDVVNIRTGIPLASIMGAIGVATGTNIGAQYASNMQVGTLKASVNISARIIDLQTGEVMFMTSASGNSKGKSQLAMEYGALGGAELNGGADGFKQTVTGKAIKKSFFKIGRNINDFFNGKAKSKVIGSASGFNDGMSMLAKGTRLYLGTEKLNKEGVAMAFENHPELYFNYKKNRALGGWQAWGTMLAGLGFGTFIGVAGEGELDHIALPLMGAGIGAGIYMKILANKRTKKLADQYNMLQSNQAFNDKDSYSLGIVTSHNKIGLVFNF